MEVGEGFATGGRDDDVQRIEMGNDEIRRQVLLVDEISCEKRTAFWGSQMIEAQRIFAPNLLL